MNRPFIKLLAGVGAVGLVLLYLFNSWFYTPYRTYNEKIFKLKNENSQKKGEVRKIQDAKREIEEKWHPLSLSSAPEVASLSYTHYLKEMLRRSKLDGEVSPMFGDVKTLVKSDKKKFKHLILPYQIRTKGDFAQIVKLIGNFEKTPLAHRVKLLSLHRADSKETGEVNVVIQIEGMIVAGADNQPTYKISAATPDDRNYTDIGLRNPFVGAVKPPPPPPPPMVAVVEEEPEAPKDTGPDVREFVKLSTIVLGDREEAYFRNMLYGEEIRLRTKGFTGYNIFRIGNEDRTRIYVNGKVLKIDPRCIYFQTGEDVYRMEMGESMARAMRRPMSDDEMEEAGVKSLYDPEFAEKSKAPEKEKSSSKFKGKKK